MGKTTDVEKLPAKDFRLYNNLAEVMEYYVSLQSSIASHIVSSIVELTPRQHNHFRSEWNALYSAVPSPSPSSADTPRHSTAFLVRAGLSFVGHLSLHHDIEETHIFPLLAMRMPAFRVDANPIAQHKEIHKGMDELEAYLRECRMGKREIRREEVKGIMDGFGEVLWTHLEEEVRELGPQKMFLAGWTPDDMMRMPM